MLKLLTSDYAEKVLQFTSGAKSTIDILCYIVNFNLYKKSDKANLIFLELKKSVTLGRQVRFLLDFPRIHKPNYHPIKFFTRRFKEAGFLSRYLHSGQTQHAKLIIFDSEVAIMGSHNLTTKSVISEHDLSILLDDNQIMYDLLEFFHLNWLKSIEV